MKSDFTAMAENKAIDCHFIFRGNKHHFRSFNDEDGNLLAVVMDADIKAIALRNEMLNDSEELSAQLQQGIPLSDIIKRYEGGSSLESVYGHPNVKFANSFWHAGMQILKREYLPETLRVPMISAAPKHNLRVIDGGPA